MNCLIIHPEELLSEERACLEGKRREHALKAHELTENITVRAAILGGKRGTARVSKISTSSISLELSLTEEPFPRLRQTWIVAISRPQTNKKIFQLAATLGIEELHLIRTSRVVKSYLQSPVLESENIDLEILKGIEQSGDSRTPRVTVHRFFRSFMEEKLPALIASAPLCFIADTHAGEKTPDKIQLDRCCIFAIGPESGWSEAEVIQFQRLNFEPIRLGQRFLRVDTACVYLSAHLEALRG